MTNVKWETWRGVNRNEKVMPIGEPTMPTEEPKLTDEERARIAELEKSRTLSDAELLKGGAEYVVNENGEKELDLTHSEYFNRYPALLGCKSQMEHVDRVEAILEEINKDRPKREMEIRRAIRGAEIGYRIFYLNKDGSVGESLALRLSVERADKGRDFRICLYNRNYSHVDKIISKTSTISPNRVLDIRLEDFL